MADAVKTAKPVRASSITEQAGTNGNNGHHKGRMKLRLVDHLGRTTQAKIPSHLPLSKVKEKIIDHLQVSPFDSNGQPVVYDLVHKGKVLGETDTLSGAGVLPDEELELSPS